MFAWLRGEREPSWAKHFRLDAADTLRRGLRYLDATEDAAFHPGRPSARLGKLTVYQLADQIREGSPSACVAALWELGRRGAAAAEGVADIQGCLSHGLADIRAEAARTLAALGPVGRPAVPTLVEVLDDADAEVRAAAAFALGKLGVQSEVAPDVVAALAERLADSDTETACAAAWAMAQFGRAAADRLPAVLDVLTQAISRHPFRGDRLRCLRAAGNRRGAGSGAPGSGSVVRPGSSSAGRRVVGRARRSVPPTMFPARGSGDKTA